MNVFRNGLHNSRHGSIIFMRATWKALSIEEIKAKLKVFHKTQICSNANVPYFDWPGQVNSPSGVGNLTFAEPCRPIFT